MIGRLRRVRLVEVLLVAVCCVLVPCALVSSSVLHNPNVSVFDETAHLDYLERARDGSYPRMGDRISDGVALEAQCRLSVQVGGMGCDVAPQEPKPDFIVPDGYSYQSQHTPLYYWITAALVPAYNAVGAETLFVQGRLVGMVWLSVGLVVLYAALRRFRIGPGIAAASCLLLSAGPGVVQANSTIGNDAACLLGGAMMLLGYTYLRDRPGPWAVAALTATSFVVTSLKAVNIIAVGIVCVVALVELRDRVPLLRRVVYAGLPGIASVVVTLGWQWWSARVAIVPTEVVLGTVLSFKDQSTGPPIGQFVGATRNLFRAYDDGAVVTGISFAGLAAIGRMTLIASSIVASMRPDPAISGVESAPTTAATTATTTTAGDRSGSTRTLGWVTLVVMAAAGVAFNIQFYLDYELTFGPAARYGLPALPMLVVPMASLAAENRRSRVGLWLLAIVLSGASLYGISME